MKTMNLSYFRKLVILSCIVFTTCTFLQNSGQASDLGDFDPNDGAAYLKKKEALLGTSYGENVFSNPLSEEDKEIGRVIENGRRKKRTPEQIGKQVEAIQNKYRKKAAQESIKNRKLGQKRAEADYRTQISSELRLNKQASDLHGFIRYKLMKELSKTARNYKALESIEETVQKLYNIIAPAYDQLAESNAELKNIINHYNSGKYNEASKIEPLAVARNNNLIEFIDCLELNIFMDRDILETNKEIKSSAYSLGIRRYQPSEPTTDRDFYLKESQILTQQINKARDNRFKSAQEVYSHKYQDIKAQVDQEIKDPAVTLLRKKILKNRLGFLSKHGSNPESLDSFFKTVELNVNYSADAYAQVEAIIHQFKTSASYLASGEIDWDNVQSWGRLVLGDFKDITNKSTLNDSQLYREINHLINALQNAKTSKNQYNIPQGQPNNLSYHGNYKSTQRSAEELLASYSRSHRNRSLLKGAFYAGKGLVYIVGGSAAAAAGAAAIPIIIPAGISYAAWKYGIKPAYQKRNALHAELDKITQAFEEEMTLLSNTPLRRYVLKKLYQNIISNPEKYASYSSASISGAEFKDQASNLERLAGNQYQILDTLIKSAQKDPSEINNLETSLTRVREFRKKITDRVGNSNSRNLEYHGDYKLSEAQAREILKNNESHLRSQRLSGLMTSVGQFAKNTGAFFAKPFGMVQNARKRAKTFQEAIDELQIQIDHEIADPTTTPLRKSVLKHLFAKVKNTASLEKAQNFYILARSFENASAWQYNNLETILFDKLFSKNRVHPVDWSAADFSKESKEEDGLNSRLREALNLARHHRKLMDVESAPEYPRVENYHGDYKRTQNLYEEFKTHSRKYHLHQQMNSLGESAIDKAKMLSKVVTVPYNASKAAIKKAQLAIHRHNLNEARKREKRALKARMGIQEDSKTSKKIKFKKSKNRKKWKYLTDEDFNKLLDEANEKYITKLIKDDLDRTKNFEMIEKEAAYLSDLFVRKTIELRIKLREIIQVRSEIQRSKIKKEELEFLENIEFENLVREKILSVFQDPEKYNFVPDNEQKNGDFQKISAKVRNLTIDARMRRQMRAKLQEATAELASLRANPELSEKDTLYVKYLEEGIKVSQSILRYSSEFSSGFLSFMEDARKQADRKFEKIEAKRNLKENNKKEAYWRQEDSRRAKAERAQIKLDKKISKLASKRPKGLDADLAVFENKYALINGAPVVTYCTLRKATEDLDQGEWTWKKNYELTEGELNLLAQIESQAAYCVFIEAQKAPKNPPGFVLGVDNLKKETQEPVEMGPVADTKSKETFMKNYVCLPQAPDLDTFDKMENCLICFEPVEFEFKALSDLQEVPPEYDTLIQVPADEEGHRLTSCGHLIHKACLEGLDVNKGLPIYKCPKCPKAIPYHEMDAQMRLQKHGFCLDHS